MATLDSNVAAAVSAVCAMILLPFTAFDVIVCVVLYIAIYVI